MTATVQDLLQQQPDAMKEYKDSIIQAERTAEKSRIDAAVKLAMEEQAKKGAPPATLAQLRAAVPEKMEGRDALILDLLEKGATEAQAAQRVSAQLAVQNAELQKQLAGRAKSSGGSAVDAAAAGVRPLAIAGGAMTIDKAETYQEAVGIEMDAIMVRDPKLTEMQARAKARGNVSRKRPDLLEAQKKQQTEEARERQTQLRAKVG